MEELILGDKQMLLSKPMSFVDEAMYVAEDAIDLSWYIYDHYVV